MNEIILKLIYVCHILVVLFVIVTPFTNSNYFLLLHAIIVPFIVFHWIINDNTCSLTLMEQKIRRELYGVQPKKDECFTCQLIEPIYDFKKNYDLFSNYIYAFTIVLWLISVYKLYNKYSSGHIKTYNDLFII